MEYPALIGFVMGEGFPERTVRDEHILTRWKKVTPAAYDLLYESTRVAYVLVSIINFFGEYFCEQD